MCKFITIEGTDFSVHRDYVCEWGTRLRYDPATGRGYQLDDDGNRVSILSYEAFGCTVHKYELAARWCDKARQAWLAAQ